RPGDRRHQRPERPERGPARQGRRRAQESPRPLRGRARSMTRYNNAKVAAIALAALIALYGLASRTPERVAEAEVRGFLDEFFAARLSRDHRKAGEYLSDELREGQAAADPALLIGSSYLHYHTYRIEKVAPRGD